MVDLAILIGPSVSKDISNRDEAEFIEKLFKNLSSSNTDLKYGIITYGKDVNINLKLGERTFVTDVISTFLFE